MKKTHKIRLLLQELGENPYKQLNIAFFLISIIPLLTLTYVFYNSFYVFKEFILEYTRICIITGVIVLLGYTVMYSMIRNIINKALLYASKAKKADELKSKFAISLAHDLKSPLAAVKTNVAALRAGYYGGLSEPQKECITICDDVAGRMDSMIMELIDTYKFEAHEATLSLNRMDLRDIVDEQLREMEPIARLKNIKFAVDYPANALSVNADRDKIVRVVNNILNNSIKYTPENGKVTVRLYPDAAFARMETTNTGNSISEDMLEKIFDKFERLDTTIEGHGLGLAIAKDIVELHNGKIWAESGNGKPTRFIVCLPLATRIRTGTGNKILIIEDDKNLALSLKNSLTQKHYDVLVSNDAASGIRRAGSDEPSLIILDLGLPGVDELFVLKSLRSNQETIDIPVIISTGSITEGIERKVRDTGADDFIHKPYDIEKLLAKIQALLPASSQAAV
jgi:signal transduction histidine kinase